MTPHHPNCVVDVSDVWERKERAMDELRHQMTFSGQHFPRYYRPEHLERMVPGWGELEDDYARGRAMHKSPRPWSRTSTTEPAATVTSPTQRRTVARSASISTLIR
jgi:LmbE family N-acetylglucosaminyl deacetylase